MKKITKEITDLITLGNELATWIEEASSTDEAPAIVKEWDKKVDKVNRNYIAYYGEKQNE